MKRLAAWLILATVGAVLSGCFVEEGGGYGRGYGGGYGYPHHYYHHDYYRGY